MLEDKEGWLFRNRFVVHRKIKLQIKFVEMFDTSCDAITKKHLSKSQHHTPNFLSNGLSNDFVKSGAFSEF